jgi:single-strand DNA-binding protein
MLNRVMLLGHIGQDPEIRSTQTGIRVATLSLATSERWTDSETNEKKERTEWHRIVVWPEGLVGLIEKYVHKGSKLYIEGALRTRKWQDQHGTDRYSTEVVLSGFNSQIRLLDKADGTYERRPPAPLDDDAIPF